jgi:PAS domain S-box-containing protein
MPDHDLFFNPKDEAAGILAAIVESSDDAIIGKDLNGVVLTWNKGAERMYGYSAEEMVGRSVSILMPDGRADELATILEQVRAGTRVDHYETVRRTKNGQLVDISLAVSPIKDALGHIVGASAIARDMTARKRTEIELGTSEARWRSIINSAVDGIIVIDAHGRVEAFNPAAERLFGYTKLEVLGQNVTHLMPSPDREKHDQYLAEYRSTGVRKIIGIGREVTGRRRDGSLFPLHLSVGEMSLAGEQKFTGILHDLSEQLELENRLRTSEARWRSIVESAVDGIVVIDAHGRVEAFNPAAERLFGYTEHEVLGQNVRLLMPAPYRDEHDHYLARYLATHLPKIIGMGREVTGRRRDGSLFPLHLSVGEMSLGGEPKFTGILHDLTARVQLEERLREQTALARLGEMAAVIAHEVKNPLAGVRGAIEVIGGRLPASSREASVVKEILARLDALNDLMQNLLRFARPVQPRPAPTDVASLLKVTAGLLSQDPALEHLHVDVDGSAPPILADPDLLKIVFLNLLLNGAHAMQGRGTIRVSVTGESGFCQVTISDDGPGIPKETREKLFTPFFTTKARGTGLGLATAKRLVEAHHGSIRIDCPVGGGTTVTVELPAQGA